MTTIIKNNQELLDKAVDGVISYDESIVCDFNVDTGRLSIKARNIDARNIDAWNIKAWNIDAWSIKARNIDARNIDAWNIKAWNIKALDIVYHVFCISYNSIECTSIKGKRDNHLPHGNLIIRPKETEFDKLLKAKGLTLEDFNELKELEGSKK